MKRWRSYKRWIDMVRPLQPPVYRDVTGKMTDIVVLNYIKDMFEMYTHVPESVFLKEFAALDTVPNTLNPKYIIQKMLQRYFSNVVRVYNEPDFSQTIIFTFSTYLGDKRTLPFSNSMKFNEDISIICFLFHISLFNSIPDLRYNFKTSETVRVLTRLMRNKYGIDFDHESLPPENKFTMFTIAQCFPSITYDMIHNNSKPIGFNIKLADLSTLFPDFDLPKTIFMPRIIMVLPKLEDPPIATLLAISIKLDDLRAPAMTPKCPLDSTYNQILEVYNHPIVPERLKLEICTKWNIVEKQNNVYKFASCFATHRLKAKSLISELRPDDPKLNDILSKI